MMMRGRLHLRRGPLASAWRSSAWLICGRGWASKRALLQSSLHLAWLLDWHTVALPTSTPHWACLYLFMHIQELFEATVRKQLSNKSTEILLLELDCIVQVSGLREYDEEDQIIVRINEISLDPLKLFVSGFKSCPEGELPHSLVDSPY